MCVLGGGAGMGVYVCVCVYWGGGQEWRCMFVCLTSVCVCSIGQVLDVCVCER